MVDTVKLILFMYGPGAALPVHGEILAGAAPTETSQVTPESLEATAAGHQHVAGDLVNQSRSIQIYSVICLVYF